MFFSMEYVILIIFIILAIVCVIMRNISSRCSPISDKDIGKQFKRVDDPKFGSVLQECDEESRMVQISNDVLDTIPKEKLVRLISIKDNIPTFR